MEIAILGLSKSGKTTIFNALTKGKAETAAYASTSLVPNIGMCKVPEPRLEVLEHINDDLGLISILPDNAFIVLSVPNFDDPGHVRWFDNPEQAAERYISLIEFEFYKPYKDIVLTHEWYILSGRKRPARIEPKQSLPPEAFKNVGRNDPCPCGSGKKYKKCCLNIR